MPKNKSNRGKDPSIFTIMKLCAITGGRCQFCNKFLLTDQFTYQDNNDSNVAHIVASSPNGPRGREGISHELSNDISNLMLLCQEHHHLIDNKKHLDTYTVEYLKSLKQSREERFAQYGSTLDLPETTIVTLYAKIKNKDEVNYSLQQMVASFLLQMKPTDLQGIELKLSCSYDYTSQEYWVYMKRQLKELYLQKIIRKLELNPQAHFSVFPLAPIPLIIQLGYLIGDRVNNTIHQKFRSPSTWMWLDSKKTNDFTVTTERISKGNKIALIVEISSQIATHRITDIYNANVIFRIRANDLGVDAIKSEADLNEFCIAYLSVCDNIKNNFQNVDEIAVFPAIPVSVAFEMGRRYMKGVYPKFTIYDECDKFIKTLTLEE